MEAVAMPYVYARRRKVRGVQHVMRGLEPCALLLLATLFIATPIRAGEVVSAAASPFAQPKSMQQVGLPQAATPAAIPANDPRTPAKVELGQRLFFDSRLSADGTIACSTCHDPARAFTDGRPVSIGIAGRAGQRNAPTVLNALYNKTQFWDGRATTLEQQAGLPIVNSVEMGQPNLDAAVAAIAAIPEYGQKFVDVFGSPPDTSNLVRAIAAYERTQVAFDSPFDHFIAGDHNAIDAAAQRG
jgi:cytochrome c peroxidase